MKSGRMRQQLQLSRPVKARDGFESPNPDYVDVFQTPADVSSVNGREFFGAGRELGEVTWRITMRTHPDYTIEPDWRGIDVDTGAVYDFVAVLPSRQRDFVTIAAKSGSST